MDEEDWHDGVAFCSVTYEDGKYRLSAETWSLPPEWCPYVVEHVVSQQC